MKKKALKLGMMALAAGMALPLAAHAAEADLQVRIDKLTQQMEELKGQVQRMDEKSLGKWLQISGDYRFRVDSLHGRTVSYTSPNAMFAYMGKNALLNTNAGSMFGGMPVGQVLQSANYSMGRITTYQAARAQAAGFMTQLNALYGQLVTPGQTNFPATGDSTITYPAYRPKNETLYTNKISLDLKAKATRDVTINVKLGMYKVFGSQDDSATNGNAFFADRVGAFDGTLAHVPSNSYLDVDRAYATWSNIMEQPVWFSVGRRPSTEGAPSNLKLNKPRPGNGGTPALLVDYAFDGMTLGYAPDIEMLPGFYAKVCYGRGFDSGFRQTPTNSLRDTDMLGVAVIPVDTDALRIWTQWNRGFNIFDFPVMKDTAFGNTKPSVNLGEIDWFGIGAMSTLKKVGPGDLNFFVDGGLSITRPNQSVSPNAGFQGLMTGGFMDPEVPTSKTGFAVYAGARYDLPSKTKLGFEFNYGSKNWITFAPAADDMWTAKVGTRGKVYEPYVIQELDLKPISSFFAKTFFKLGYQFYDFDYTGSNNWVGRPIKLSDVRPTTLLLQAPLRDAHNVYGTFEVHF